MLKQQTDTCGQKRAQKQTSYIAELKMKYIVPNLSFSSKDLNLTSPYISRESIERF